MADLMAQLEEDPAHLTSRQHQAAEHELREREVQIASQPLLDELAAAGYPLVNFDELLSRYAPLKEPVVNVLLSRVLGVRDKSVQQQVVRALGASAVPFSGMSITRLFDSTDSESLRFAIANTLAEAPVTGVSDWLLRAARDASTGTAQQMLLLAVARHIEPTRASPLLLELLDALPGHAALALAEVGGGEELKALRLKYETTRGWVKTQIGRAIAVIERRISLRES